MLNWRPCPIWSVWSAAACRKKGGVSCCGSFLSTDPSIAPMLQGSGPICRSEETEKGCSETAPSYCRGGKVDWRRSTKETAFDLREQRLRCHSVLLLHRPPLLQAVRILELLWQAGLLRHCRRLRRHRCRPVFVASCRRRRCRRWMARRPAPGCSGSPGEQQSGADIGLLGLSAHLIMSGTMSR